MRDVRPGELVHLPRPHAETHVFAVDAAAGLPFRLPDGLKPESGTLLQTTTIALQAVHDASLKLGDRVAIFGLGTFGLLDRPACPPCRVRPGSQRPTRLPDRRALAGNLGADLVLDPATTDVGLELRQLDGVGVDVAVEFSGSYAALQQAMRSVRVGGTVVAAGFYAGGELALGEEFHHNRLTLRRLDGRLGVSTARAALAEIESPLARRGPPRRGRLQRGRTDHAPLAFADAGSAYELIDESRHTVLRAVFVYE